MQAMRTIQWDKISTCNTICKKTTVSVNYLRILQTESAKYLGLHLDRGLNWNKHIFTKGEQLAFQLAKICWLFSSKSQLSAESKLWHYTKQFSIIFGLTASNCGIRSSIQIWKHYKISKTNTLELWLMLHDMSPVAHYIMILKDMPLGICSSKLSHI